ncbi:E3 ubiquitin-protein ligase RNF34 isoform X2 [Aplysia californica]|uniref:E3 ubiquitin-protein ligase RNF34 isoform X2 n=1 Tax=Aplysia californica TaxID=6500 RepID=A0ABM0JUX1_APLCA|nr:E3 ubiquitin-protein ligase RNF34 isoform X2 [Aplysia californica]
MASSRPHERSSTARPETDGSLKPRTSLDSCLDSGVQLASLLDDPDLQTLNNLGDEGQSESGSRDGAEHIPLASLPNDLDVSSFNEFGNEGQSEPGSGNGAEHIPATGSSAVYREGFLTADPETDGSLSGDNLQSVSDCSSFQLASLPDDLDEPSFNEIRNESQSEPDSGDGAEHIPATVFSAFPQEGSYLSGDDSQSVGVGSDLQLAFLADDRHPDSEEGPSESASAEVAGHVPNMTRMSRAYDQHIPRDDGNYRGMTRDSQEERENRRIRIRNSHCKTCLGGTAETLNLPCRHVSYCKECAAIMKKCTICETIIDHYIDVLLS